MARLKIRTDCAGNISRPFETIDDLIAYQNSKPKEILCIYLTARSEDYSESVRIRFGNYFRAKISINLTVGENALFNLKENILDVIAGMQPWYAIMHRINLTYAFWSGYLILMLIWFLSFVSHLALNFKWGTVSDSDKEITSLAALSRNTLLAFALLFWGLGMFFNKLRDFFFPPIVFTIGHGKSRFKNKERLQWVVIIGFVVSLAAGLVVPIIMTLLRIF